MASVAVLAGIAQSLYAITQSKRQLNTQGKSHEGSIKIFIYH